MEGKHCYICVVSHCFFALGWVLWGTLLCYYLFEGSGEVWMMVRGEGGRWRFKEEKVLLID